MTIRPIGYFVHHQGRGHAERCAALVNALQPDRAVTVFCARPTILPPMRPGVEVVGIPSLFEPTGDEAIGLNRIPQPDTVHCAPLGWPGIRGATATIARWFGRADPALFISDVSAELAQLARLCSVPHVGILQHGHRDDPGHRAGWSGAVGMLAPFDRALAQPDWPRELIDKTFFAGGPAAVNGIDPSERPSARERLGIDPDRRLFLVMTGAGGDAMSSAALAVGARTFNDTSWHTIGPVQRTWHATEPSNLIHHGWVDDADDYLAAADLVISTVGNTTTQQILAAGKPWIAVPQWCYFDEQVCKARALSHAGLAHHEPHLPSHAGRWRQAVASVFEHHDADLQRSAITLDAHRLAARWLERLCASLWSEPAPMQTRPVSVLTLASGRQTHLHHLMLGLERQKIMPDELIVGVMQERLYEGLPDTTYPVHQVSIGGDGLPLAAARNAVARRASNDVLIFLDVDCIPAPSLTADYAHRVRPDAGVFMGEVRYLPEGATAQGWTCASLERDAVVHDARADAPERDVEPCGDYRCFWSLNFALHRKTFEASGGFDEGYAGYGGEDTDFGRTLTERGIALHWMRGARAYHQFHDQRMPPVHHLESVVRNAERFERKWGHRTMEHWLYCFWLMELIEDSGDGIRILAADPVPDRALDAACAGAPYASTARAIEHLEARAIERYRHRHGQPPPDGWLDRKRFLHRPPSADEPADASSDASVEQIVA